MPLSSQNLHEIEAQFRYTIKGSTKMAEYDPMPELLALKVIVQFLLSEKVSEFKDENAAVFEISKACSEVISTRRRPAMPVTRHGRQQRKSGGVGTKPEARRIAANIAKLPDLLKRPQY